MKEAILLIDCNSFFVSCELVFRPDLRGRPVVVLSNNDGCVVARSKEAKQIGIPMCAPLFTIESLVKTFDVVLFSSNFSLYNDMSQRIMHVLKQFCEKMECYSIDEAFITLSYDDNILKTAELIRKTILKEIGIPVSIGISWTKTLSKIASEIAKKSDNGIYALLEDETIDHQLKKTKVDEIWGVGRKNAPKLCSYGIFNAYQLKKFDKSRLRKLFNIVLVKTALELDSIPSFQLEEIPQFPQSITKSASFKESVFDLTLIKEALSTFAVQAAEKLFSFEGVTCGLIVFLMTNRFRDSFYSNSIYVSLDMRTCYAPAIIKGAIKGLEKIFILGLSYKKVGITLVDLQPKNTQQLDFIQDHAPQNPKHEQLMGAISKVKDRFGIDSIQFAAEGCIKPWRSKKELRSPFYTTAWSDILTINI